MASVNLVNFEINKDWFKTIMAQLVKIPTWLKWALGAAVLCGAIYYGYEKVYKVDELHQIQKNIEQIQQKIDESVENDDYTDDLVYLVTAISALQRMQQYMYNEEQEQLELMEKFMKKSHPDDEMIYSIETMHSHNEYMFKALQLELNNALKKCQSKHVKEMIQRSDSIQ